MSAQARDFLELEAPLIARLRAVLPPDVHVLGVRDLATVAEGSQPTPAVHVLYQGYRPQKQAASMYEELELRWLTVVAVHNAGDPVSGTGARLDAGPLMGAVIDALAPWVPPLDGYQSMHLTDAPMTGYRAGYGYFPLGWRVGVKRRVAPARQRRT